MHCLLIVKRKDYFELFIVWSFRNLFLPEILKNDAVCVYLEKNSQQKENNKTVGLFETHRELFKENKCFDI